MPHPWRIQPQPRPALEDSGAGRVRAAHMFIHCHSVHDYPALPPEAAYKWPLKRGGQGVGRAEWPGCRLRHSLTALSRSLSRPFIWAVGEGEKSKSGRNKRRARLPAGAEKRGRLRESPGSVWKSSFFFFAFRENLTFTVPLLICSILLNDIHSPMFATRHQKMWRWFWAKG